MTQTFSESSRGALFNPTDVIEAFLIDRHLPCSRADSVELSTELEGHWDSYHVRFFWQEEAQILHVMFFLDLLPQPQSFPNLYEVLTLINERVLVGHFDFDRDAQRLAYRYSFLVPHTHHITLEMIEAQLHFLIEMCDRFYPAVGMVAEARAHPDDVIAAVMMDTQGEA